jgi:CheY-like chemotaxis protein
MTLSDKGIKTMNDLTVLCVEDDDLTRLIIRQFLVRRATKVILAKDGAEGLLCFNACKPDLVVTDICMPVMDGLQMAALIRESDPSIPIVFITSAPERLSKFDRFDRHLDRVINKSIDFHELSEILKHYIPMAA